MRENIMKDEASRTFMMIGVVVKYILVGKTEERRNIFRSKHVQRNLGPQT
jgi:hypothetical protein